MLCRVSSVCSLLQCSSTCGKGLQSRVVQCMHKVTGRHGSECPALAKPAAYRQCHQEVCNDRINVNTITSPRLGESGPWGEGAQGLKLGEGRPDCSLNVGRSCLSPASGCAWMECLAWQRMELRAAGAHKWWLIDWID